jgi:hypothetical protein
MRRNHERGVALILAMILILIMSIIAISMTFVAKGETLSSWNYRLMSQARDAAEAGVNQAANYLMYTYAVPGGTTGSDPITGVYDVTTSPVKYGGNNVVLSADSNVPANYPISSVTSAFSGEGYGSLAAGATTVKYATSAKLLFMRELDKLPVYLSTGGNNTVQTWEITSTGTISGIQPATVNVVAKLERRIIPIFGYAAFATYPNCDALNFGGGGTTDSYNSLVANTDPNTMFTNDGGNVGTNGGLSTVGSTTNIGGTLSTPRVGVGNCNTGSGTVTALDGSLASVDGGIIQLPTTINYPTPSIPPPGSGQFRTNNVSDCTSLGAQCGNVTDPVTGSVIGRRLTPPAPLVPGTLPTMSLGDINITGGIDLYLEAGVYNINSITETGLTTLHIASGPVYLNVTGNGFNNNQTPIALTGGGISNPGSIGPPAYPPDPTMLQIAYAGTAKVQITGGTEAAALIYAPNATGSITGGSDFYGSFLANKIADFGGAAVHYDRNLDTKVLKAGPYTLDSFNWRKY